MRWEYVTEKLAKRSRQLSFYRGVLFTLFSLSLLAFYAWPSDRVWVLVSVVFLALFFWLVRQHVRVRCYEVRALHRRKISIWYNAMKKVDWSELPSLNIPPGVRIDEPHFHDLLLIRDRGLIRLLSRIGSDAGYEHLVKLFSQKNLSPEEFYKRQALVKELQELRLWRRRLLEKLTLDSCSSELNKIKSWILSKPTSISSLYYFCWVLQIAFLATLFFQPWLKGFFPSHRLAQLSALLAFGLILAQMQERKRLKTAEIYALSQVLQASFGHLKNVLKELAHSAIDSKPYLSELAKPFRLNSPLSQQMQRLSGAAGAMGVRQNFIVHILIHFLMPWDLWWARRFIDAHRVLYELGPDWIDRFARMEAFLSLAEFSASLENACFPRLAKEDSIGVTATDLFHPLLSPEKRKSNSFILDSKVRCALITGSNMSGKSTFLRSLGLALVLARTGSRVPARDFCFQLLPVMTSIGVEDSLTDALSAFYAEAKRLSEIHRTAHTRPIYFLVDEIYRGTNNQERLQGSQALIVSLSSSRSFGVVTTHDLELTKLSRPTNSIVNFHFSEFYEEGIMKFSYQIKAGPSPSTNALQILRDLGLPT